MNQEPKFKNPSMKKSIFRGIGFAVIFFLSLELVEHGGFVFMLTGLILGTVALVRGPRLHLLLRTFTTACVFYWAYAMCLIGRTTSPGINQTNMEELALFAALGVLPSFLLLRIWNDNVSFKLLGAIPLSFALALGIAQLEEYLFVQMFKESGAGPTPRITVSMHWLAYDQKKQLLYGSD